MTNKTTYHIIVADDTDSIRGLIVRVIARTYAAIRISSVTDGQDALDIFFNEGADLIVTNNDMPRVKGLELIRRVRAVQPDLPIIMVSGDPTIAPAAFAVGATRFVDKPFTVMHLAQVLTSLLPA